MALSSANETSHRNGSEDFPEGLEELQHEEILLEELLGPEASLSLETLGFRAQQLRHHFLEFCVRYNKAYPKTKLDQGDIERLLDTIQSLKQEDSIDKFLVQFRHLAKGWSQGQDAIVTAWKEASIEDYRRLLLELRLDPRLVNEYESTVEAQYRIHLKTVLVRFIRRHYSCNFTKQDKVTVIDLFNSILMNNDNFRDNFKSLAETNCCFEHPSDCACTHELMPHTCLHLMPVEFEVFKRECEEAAKDTRENATLEEINNKPGLGNSMIFEHTSPERESASANDHDALQAHIVSEMGENVMEKCIDVNGDAEQDIRVQLLGAMRNQPNEPLQGDTELRVGTASRKANEANDADKPPRTSRLPRVVPLSEDGNRRTNRRKYQAVNKVETPKRRSEDDRKPAATRRSSRQAAMKAAQNQESLSVPEIIKSKTSGDHNENGSFAREYESNDESADDDEVLDPMVEMHRRKDPGWLAPEVTSGSMAEAVVGRADRRTPENVPIQNADVITEGSAQVQHEEPDKDVLSQHADQHTDMPVGGPTQEHHEELQQDTFEKMDIDDDEIRAGEARQLPSNMSLPGNNGSISERRETTFGEATVTSKKRQRSTEDDDQQPRQISVTVDSGEVVQFSLNATKKRRMVDQDPRQQPPRAAKMRFADAEANNLKKKKQLRSNKKNMAQKQIEDGTFNNEKQKYKELSAKINEHLHMTIMAVDSEEAKGILADDLLQTIDHNLRHENVASYYMAVSLLLRHRKISDNDLPNSAFLILKPLSKLLDEKPYKPCIHPDFRCKKAQCFEQWYDLTRKEHSVASFRQFKAAYWLRDDKKYSSQLKTDFRLFIKIFNRDMIDVYGLTPTLRSDDSRKALRGIGAGGLLPLETTASQVQDASKSKQGRSGFQKTAGRNGTNRLYMPSGASNRAKDGQARVLRRKDITRARLIEEFKAAKESLPESYLKQYDEIKVLKKQIEKLEADNAEQKDALKTKSDRISALEQEEAAWIVDKTRLDQDKTRLDSRHKRQVQNLEDKKKADDQLKDEEIRKLKEELETRKESNKEEEQRHKTEKEAVDNALRASEAKLTENEIKHKEFTDKLKEENNNAQSNLHKQTTILRKWASAAYSYTESRMKWVKEEKLGELDTQVELLRIQIDNKDNPDHVAIYEAWDRLERNENLPTIETKIAEHNKARKGVVEVVRQCLFSISTDKVASGEVEMPVNDMINSLKSAGLDSKPALQQMTEFFSKASIEKLNSDITKAQNAVEVYEIHKPIFLLMNKIWTNKKDLQDQLKDAREDHEGCAKSLKSLQDSKNEMKEKLDIATKEHKDCAKTLKSLQDSKKEVVKQLDDFNKKHKNFEKRLQSLQEQKNKVEEQLKNTGEDHEGCAETLKRLQDSRNEMEEKLNIATNDHRDCAETLQSLQEQLKNAGKESDELNRTLQLLQESKVAVKRELALSQSALMQQKQWSEAVKLMEAVHELYTASRGTGQTGSELSKKTLQKAVNKSSEGKLVHTEDGKTIDNIGEDSDKSNGGNRSQDPEQRIKDCMLNSNLADKRLLRHWHSGRCGCEDFLIEDGKVSTTKNCKLHGLSLTVSASSAASDACLSMWQWIESAFNDFTETARTLKETIASREQTINMLEQKIKEEEAAAKEDLAKKTTQDDDLDRNIDHIEEQISLINFVQSIQNKSHNKIVPKSLKSGKCADRHVLKCLHILLCECDVVFPTLWDAPYDVKQYEACSPNFKNALPETIDTQARVGTVYETFYEFLSAKARCCRLEAKCSKLETERSKLRSILNLYRNAFLYCARLTVEPFDEEGFIQHGDEGLAKREVRKAKLAQVWELLTTSVEKTEQLNDSKILKYTESYSDSKPVDTEKILSQLVGVEEIVELAAVKSELEELKKRDADKVNQSKVLMEKLEKHKSIVKFVISVHDTAESSSVSSTLESDPKVSDWVNGKVIEDLHTILCKPDCTRDFSNLKENSYAPENYNDCSKAFLKALPENITDKNNKEYKLYHVFLSAVAERCKLDLELKKTSDSNATLHGENMTLKKDLLDQRAEAIKALHDFARLVAQPLFLKDGNQASTEYEDRGKKLERVGLWLKALLEAAGKSENDKLTAPLDIYTESESTPTTEQVFSLLVRMQDVPIFEQKILNLATRLQSKDTEFDKLISSWTKHYPRAEDWTTGEIIECIIKKEEHECPPAVKEEEAAGTETTEVKEELYYDQIVTEKEVISRQLRNVEARYTLMRDTLKTLSRSTASFQKFTSCLESGYIGTKENIVTLHMILSESVNMEPSGDVSVKHCEDAKCAGAFLHRFLMNPPIKEEEDADPIEWATDRDISDELRLLGQVQVFWVSQRELNKKVSEIVSLGSSQPLQKTEGDFLTNLEIVANFKMDCMLSAIEYFIYKEDREGQGREKETNDQVAEQAICQKTDLVGLDLGVISAYLDRKKHVYRKERSSQNERSEKGRCEKNKEHDKTKDNNAKVHERFNILKERITAEQLRFQDTEEQNLQFNQELKKLWAVCTGSQWIPDELPQGDETQTGREHHTAGQLTSIMKFISDMAQQLRDVESDCDIKYTKFQDEAQNNAQLSNILSTVTWPAKAADYLGRILQKSDAIRHMTDLRLELKRTDFLMALKDVTFSRTEGESQLTIKDVLKLAKDGGLYYEQLDGYLRTVSAKGEEAPGINPEQCGTAAPNQILFNYDPIIRFVLSSKKKIAEEESQIAASSKKIMELYAQCGGRSGTVDQPDTAGRKVQNKYEPLISRLNFLITWVADHPSRKQEKSDVNRSQGHHASTEELQAAIRKGRQAGAGFENILKQSEQALKRMCNSLEPGTLEKLKDLIQFPPYNGSLAEQLAAQLHLARFIGFSEGWQLEVKRVNLIPTLNNLGPGTDVAKVRKTVKEIGLSCQKLVLIFPVLDCGESMEGSNEIFELYKSHYKAKIHETQKSSHPTVNVELRTADCDDEIPPDDGSVDLIRPTFETEDGVKNIEIDEQFADFLRKFCQDKHIELSDSEVQARIHDQKRILGQMQSSEQLGHHQIQSSGQLMPQQIDSSPAVANIELKIDKALYRIVNIRPGNGGHYAFEVFDKNKIRQKNKGSLGKILKSGSADEVKQNRATIHKALKDALSQDIPGVQPKEKETEMKLPGMLRFEKIEKFTKPNTWHVRYVGGGKTQVSGCTLAGWGLDVCAEMEKLKPKKKGVSKVYSAAQASL